MDWELVEPRQYAPEDSSIRCLDRAGLSVDQYKQIGRSIVFIRKVMNKQNDITRLHEILSDDSQNISTTIKMQRIFSYVEGMITGKQSEERKMLCENSSSSNQEENVEHTDITRINRNRYN